MVWGSFHPAEENILLLNNIDIYNWAQVAPYVGFFFDNTDVQIVCQYPPILVSVLGIFNMEPGRQKYMKIYENIPVSPNPTASDRQQKYGSTKVQT